LKQIILSKSGAQKLRQQNHDLYQRDFEGKLSGHYPGEWLIVVDNKKNHHYLGHIYSLFEDKAFVYLHEKLETNFDTNGSINIETYLVELLNRALDYREQFKSYFPHARLVYGGMDRLPGLTIDGYDNVNVVELNSCAYDSHMELIAKTLQLRTGRRSVFHIKRDRRLEAGIPVAEVLAPEIQLEIKENDLDLVVLEDVFQKNGYYYDHRENRLRARRVIRSLKQPPKTALDLFCYVGSWGLSFLMEGCERVSFVDQGSLAENVSKNLNLNNFDHCGEFFQEDVFKFLDRTSEQFDLVCSDPPAFAKNKKSKKRAIEGYTKLHTKALKKVLPGGLFIAASCTKYVSLYEFQKTVSEAANKLNRQIRMLDVGLQGVDHPMVDFDSNSNYIKYLMYHVE
jgi:23S rRNA (cytosine1962-C5)-methyltransferase